MKNRGRSILVSAFVAAAVLAVGIVPGVLAQGRPGGPPPMGGPGGPPMGPPITMEVGASDVYVLAGPTLIKYNASLEKQGAIEVIEMPAPPTGSAGAPPPPPPHPIMLLAGSANGVSESLLILFGDKFIRVDGATMTQAAGGTLPALDMPGPPGPHGPMAFELKGTTLYVLRGPQIVALNIKDGSQIGAAVLPKPEDR